MDVYCDADLTKAAFSISSNTKSFESELCSPFTVERTAKGTTPMEKGRLKIILKASYPKIKQYRKVEKTMIVNLVWTGRRRRRVVKREEEHWLVMYIRRIHT